MAVDSERPAITLLDERGNERETWTRDRLSRRAVDWQHRIEKTVRPGDRVVLSPERSPEMAVLHLGALACGAVVVPLNPALSPAEKRGVTESAAPALIVTGTDMETRQATASPHRIPPSTALLLFTSGTTGRPKSVPLTHDNLLANLTALADLWQRSERDRVLHMLPAHHFHGLVLALYGSLLAGSHIVLMPRFDARGALDAIARYAVNVVMGVPTMYARIVDAARKDGDLSGLRLAVSGSAPLGASLWSRFYERFGVPLIERYGLTETGIVTSNPPDAPRGGSVGKPIEKTTVVIAAGHGQGSRPDGSATPGARRREPARGFPGVSAEHDARRHESALDESVAPAPSGLRYHEPTPGRATPRGEICVSGPAVSAGYGNDPEATAAAYRDGFFHTGDLGYFDEDGYLWIDGRIKELIIVGGSNVIPGEVVAALEDTGGVRELTAVGIPHEDLGEVVGVVAVPSDADATADRLEAALRRRAEKRLAAYKRPRAYVFARTIPRNAMGKTDVAACRRLFEK